MQPTPTAVPEPAETSPLFLHHCIFGNERELTENLHKVEAEHFSCDMCNEPAEDALPHRLKKMEDDNRVPGWHAQSTEHPCQAWAERREDAINALHKLVEGAQGQARREGEWQEQLDARCLGQRDLQGLTLSPWSNTMSKQRNIHEHIHRETVLPFASGALPEIASRSRLTTSTRGLTRGRRRVPSTTRSPTRSGSLSCATMGGTPRSTERRSPPTKTLGTFSTSSSPRAKTNSTNTLSSSTEKRHELPTSDSRPRARHQGPAR